MDGLNIICTLRFLLRFGIRCFFIGICLVVVVVTILIAYTQ